MNSALSVFSWKSFIGQQYKAKDALSAYQQILDDMPVVQANFDLAKQGLLSQLRTNRKTGRAVFSVYLDCEKLGLTSDPNKYIFDKVQNMTLDDVVRFQQQHIKGIHYHTAILGNEKDLNMNEIAKYGTIKRVTQSEIFGF
jgi:predicted Zn-dependent peptidase